MMLKFIAFKMNTDAIIAGNVKRSPNAAIIGLVMLSGSHPCSKLLNETSIVIGSIIRLEMTPAMTLINTKSIMLIEGCFKRMHNTLAMTAKNKDNTNVKTKDANIL